MKSKVINAIAFMAYWLGIDALFYCLNRKAKRIVTFHNVLPDEMFRPGVANGVSNCLSDFLRIIHECAKKFRFSTDLFDAKTLTLTFDDGYRNQYTFAYRELRKLAIPAFVFVAGDAIDGKADFPGLAVDLLTHWIDTVPPGRYVLELHGGEVILQVSESNRLAAWSQIIWPLFVSDMPERGQNMLAACDKAYPLEKVFAKLPENYVLERLTGISAAMRAEMKTAGWKIGWHTKSHFPLAKLSEEDLTQELEAPEEFKSECLSYPYGNPVEVGAVAPRLAQCLNFPAAVSNTNEAQENASAYFLPRLSLSHDKYRLHFQLSGLEYFLKHLRLLPVVLPKEVKDA